MIRFLDDQDSISTTDFGGFSPYWTEVGGNIVVADTAEEILSVVPTEERILDPVAVMETLRWSNPLGNRTMIKGVHRMPWRATLTGDGKIERRPPIVHGFARASPKDIAAKLQRLLSQELTEACDGYNEIILTLTGGLDSRVVAGVLKKIEPEISAPISCVTWGTSESRDVAYARQIADWFDWSFTHLSYEPSHVSENLDHAAIWGGAEITGLHLHRFPWFQKFGKSDLVLMASYGDSIGRAEFAGKHLTNQQMEPFNNKWNLFDPRVPQGSYAAAEADRAAAWEGAEGEPLTTLLELHNQENFMRRGVGHAADYIRQYCNLHQAFTSGPVVEFMWSTDPRDRVDAVYHHLLRNLDLRLFDLPWARTGVAPSGRREANPMLTQNYHRLPEWLKNEISGKFAKMFHGYDERDLGVLYGPSAERLWWAFRFLPKQGSRAAGIVAKIATIRAFCEHYEVSSPRSPRDERGLRLTERAIMARIYANTASRVISRFLGNTS